jgi:hypothetical protein
MEYVKLNDRETKKTGNNRHLSILALTVNGFNAQSRDKLDLKRQIGLKNKTQTYVAYKRLI